MLWKRKFLRSTSLKGIWRYLSELRNILASYFSFRQAYIKKDLLEFDCVTQRMSEYIGNYANLQCMIISSELHGCLTNRSGYLNDDHNKLTTYWLADKIRAFHLKRGIKSFENAIQILETLLKKPSISQ